MSNTRIIAPTVGRKVWYRPNGNLSDDGLAKQPGQPLDATVVAIWGDRMINVAIQDANGTPAARTSVTLLQPGDPVPAEGNPYCEWMPYQASQAAKAAQPSIEQLQNRYSHHPPKGDQAERYAKIRDKVQQTASLIVTYTPVSPEQARALDALDNAMMLANAAIARNE